MVIYSKVPLRDRHGRIAIFPELPGALWVSAPRFIAGATGWRAGERDRLNAASNPDRLI